MLLEAQQQGRTQVCVARSSCSPRPPAAPSSVRAHIHSITKVISVIYGSPYFIHKESETPRGCHLPLVTASECGAGTGEPPGMRFSSREAGLERSGCTWASRRLPSCGACHLHTWARGSPRTETTFPFTSALHGESLGQAGQDPDRQSCWAMQTGYADVGKALGPVGSRAPWKEPTRDSQTGRGMSLGIHKDGKDSVHWAILNVTKAQDKFYHLPTTRHGPDWLKGSISLI